MSAVPDYLLIGHLAQDVVPGGYAVGGTVAYAGMTAAALGLRPAVVTSTSLAVDAASLLPGLLVHSVPAASDTIFENEYSAAGRRQRLLGRAEPLIPEHVPASWLTAPIVHLAPIADEVDRSFAALFADTLLGITPQGWHRRWDAQGRVTVGSWNAAAAVLPLATAVVLSDEDVPDAESLAVYRRLCRLLVLTHGEAGCTVYWRGEARRFSAPVVEASSLTGAGDVFAAAYFISLKRTDGDAFAAAQFANQIASQSVTQPDLAAKARHIAQVTAMAQV